ncbi:unnamed protein product, partial [Aureobasidium pullulans]
RWRSSVPFSSAKTVVISLIDVHANSAPSLATYARRRILETDMSRQMANRSNDNKCPGAFPSRLRDKHSDIQVLSAADRDTWALTPKACPKCEHPEMKFRDVQLRGADEGSTIFYRCPACDHRYVSIHQ